MGIRECTGGPTDDSKSMLKEAQKAVGAYVDAKAAEEAAKTTKKQAQEKVDRDERALERGHAGVTPSSTVPDTSHFQQSRLSWGSAGASTGLHVALY